MTTPDQNRQMTTARASTRLIAPMATAAMSLIANVQTLAISTPAVISSLPRGQYIELVTH